MNEEKDSVQQETGSIDTPEFETLLGKYAYAISDEANARARAGLVAHIHAWAAATPAQPIAPAHIERFSIYEDHGRANMMGDDDGEYVLYSHHIEALGKVAQPIAVSALTDERAAFEAHVTENYGKRAGNVYTASTSGHYHYSFIQHDWCIWQAARAAAPVSQPTNSTEGE